MGSIFINRTSAPKKNITGMLMLWGAKSEQFGSRTQTWNTMVLTAAIFITLVSLIVYLHFVKIDQESLLVIGSLGIQMTSTFASGKECTSFIEMHRVKDIVINEAIFMQKVIYYLCILLNDPSEPNGVTEIVPVFQSSQPRLDCLVEVYRSCQDIVSKKNTTVDVAE
ncbi:phosphatidylinositol N-acetylglucosaminyltransferase subunit H isoform X2 [Bombina bombina]|uniref:phosphatidylinositol N-acetylglucosaminyltransferase subunit H isoform X2 n=1 Tax=Bombina bombina TaxID=8345 RepID=UPI00235AE515|nr:phosphatidylinositol N-acetylglucosaminyltransferase subunit H isoform X2 [Bombina bombina]